MTDQTFRFRGTTPPTAASRASILTPTIEQPEGGSESTALLYLYDPIDAWGGWWGVSAKEFAEALAALPDDVTVIELHINSTGGDVWEMWAIINQLRRHEARIVAVVDGIAASAASVVAVTADETVMGVGAQLMIHDPWTVAIGNEADMMSKAQLLHKDASQLATAYARKAGGTADEWRERMRAETWYTADEALAAGLADRAVDDVPDQAAAASIDLSRFRYAGRSAAPAPRPVARATTPKTPVSPEPVELNIPPEKEDTMSEKLIEGIRNRLGVKPDADLDEDGIIAALDEALAERADTQIAAVPEGTVLVEQAQLAALQADAAAGREARKQQIQDRQAATVEDAIKAGKIPPARRDHWLEAMAADEEGTTATLDSLAAGLIPMQQVGSMGAPESTEDASYAAVYPTIEKEF